MFLDLIAILILILSGYVTFLSFRLWKKKVSNKMLKLNIKGGDKSDK
jgi:uncharacterized protein YjeT (DUF2065 family)